MDIINSSNPNLGELSPESEPPPKLKKTKKQRMRKHNSATQSKEILIKELLHNTYNKYSGNGNGFAVVMGDNLKKIVSSMSDGSSDLESQKRIIVIRIAAMESEIDAVLFLDNNPASMDIWDRDGTHETMCGNGLLIAAYVHYISGNIGPLGIVKTLDGEKQVGITENTVFAELGVPKKKGDIIEVAGVPHVVVYDEDREDVALAIKSKLGAVNINFVRIIGNDVFNHTYEVGVGFTDACGTGCTAVASTISTSKEYKFDNPLTIINPGGPIRVYMKDGSFSIEGKVVQL